MYILHLGTSAKNGVGLRLPVEFIFAPLISNYSRSVIFNGCVYCLPYTICHCNHVNRNLGMYHKNTFYVFIRLLDSYPLRIKFKDKVCKTVDAQME